MEKEEQQSMRPSFVAPLLAAGRQGLKELEQILPAFPESVHPVDEPGTLGVPTQAMVTQEIGTFHGYQSMIDGYAGRAQQREEQERGMER
ncbi:MAG: hypothetical protein JSS02_15910 [Planctomycetes bacterium]|nr:hypothetical protein [Planctomycetota bacterium]